MKRVKRMKRLIRKNKRKLSHNNIISGLKDNPFDSLWFFLHLAAISYSFWFNENTRKNINEDIKQ
jgi:hypothetical protein